MIEKPNRNLKIGKYPKNPYKKNESASPRMTLSDTFHLGNRLAVISKDSGKKILFFFLIKLKFIKRSFRDPQELF